MASKPLYQPWNHEEFIADRRVRSMGSAARKCYLMLLHEAFFCSTRPYLPDDDNELWVLADCDSLEEWNLVRDKVRSMFSQITVDGVSLLKNKRVSADWEKVQAICVKNRQNINKRWNTKEESSPETDTTVYDRSTKHPESDLGDTTVTESNTGGIQVSKEVIKKEGSKKKHFPDPLPPEQVARGVMDELGLGDYKLLRSLTDVTKSLLQRIGPDQALRDLVDAWKAYKRAIPNLEWNHSGPQKFFESDLWSDPKLWPWKDGHQPAAIAARKHVDLTDPRYQIAGGTQ